MHYSFTRKKLNGKLQNIGFKPLITTEIAQFKIFSPKWADRSGFEVQNSRIKVYIWLIINILHRNMRYV